MAFDPSTYSRLIQLVEYDAQGDTWSVVATLCNYSDVESSSAPRDVVEDAQFTLLRNGGDADGSFIINREFEYAELQTGRWIRCFYNDADTQPWYYGRIESVSSTAPSGWTVHTYGPIGQLHDQPVGGWGTAADNNRPPIRIARSDYYINDPDHSDQTQTTVSTIHAAVQALFTSSIGTLGFSLDGIGIVEGLVDADVFSYTFRGESSVSEVLRSWANNAFGSSYGFHGMNVDGRPQFFFTTEAPSTTRSYQDGVDLASLTKSEDRALMYNRLILVGGDVFADSNKERRYNFRYVARDDSNAAIYGDRPAHIHCPWIRNNQDASRFATEFFEKYGGIRLRCEIETLPEGSTLFTPWTTNLTVKDINGTDIITAETCDEVRVHFNHAPYYEIVSGPEELQFNTSPVGEQLGFGQGGDAEQLLSDFTPPSQSFSGSASSSAASSGATSSAATTSAATSSAASSETAACTVVGDVVCEANGTLTTTNYDIINLSVVTNVALVGGSLQVTRKTIGYVDCTAASSGV